LARAMASREGCGAVEGATMADRIMAHLAADPACRDGHRDGQSAPACSRDGGKASHVVDTFLPGRTAWSYAIEEEDACAISSSTDMPTTVFRSKADYSQPRFEYVLKLGEDKPIIERLANVIGYTIHSGSKKKAKSKSSRISKDIQDQGMKLGERSAPVAVVANRDPNPDPEDDIFADVGTNYEAGERDESVPESAPRGLGAHVSPRGYFQNGGGASPRGPEGNAGDACTFTYKDLDDDADDSHAVERMGSHTDVVHEIMQGGSGEADGGDAYAELFPGFDRQMYDDANAGGDGDANANVKKANRKKSKEGAQLTRVKQIFQEKGLGSDAAFDKGEEDEASKPGPASTKKKHKKKTKAQAQQQQQRQKRLKL